MTQLSNNQNLDLPPEIMPSTLSDWLNEGKEINIIDIRPERDYQYWHIAESDNIAVYDDLNKGRPGKLEQFNSEIPVVAVCYAGNTSKIAVHYLRSRGIAATSLIGGNQLWSNAWNTAVVPTPNSSTEIIQIRRTGKGCISYMLISDKQALVIDASLDPEIYIEIASNKGCEIKTVIDTHIHSDHVSRGGYLAKETGATYMLPENSDAAFPFEPITAGVNIGVGSAMLLPVSALGHTQESMTLQLDDEYLFTGDALFLSGISRLASHEENLNQQGLNEMAAAHYKTLIGFAELPQSITVLPGHSSHPIFFDGIPISISLEKANKSINALTKTEENFINLITAITPPVPRTHALIVQLNKNGQFAGGNIQKLEGGQNHAIINV